MDKRNDIKKQTMTQKAKIEQHDPHKKPGG
jgi:hypothetical protein